MRTKQLAVPPLVRTKDLHIIKSSVFNDSQASTMERQELLEIIDRAADEQWTELDLAGMDLTELPPEIGKLTQLKSLILSKIEREKRIILGNQITDLPPEIGKLTNLNSYLVRPTDKKRLRQPRSNRSSKIPRSKLELLMQLKKVVILH